MVGWYFSLGILNIVYGYDPTFGAPFTSHMDVDKVFSEPTFYPYLIYSHNSLKCQQWMN